MRTRRPSTTGLAVLGLMAGGLAYASPASAAVPEPPITEPASEVTGTSATLNGVLNPKKKAKAGYHFAYGSEGSCEGRTTEPVAEATVKALKASATITGLIPHTTYTFCLVATNTAGVAEGLPLFFETPPVPPAIEKESASSISQTTASLSALINPEFQETTCRGFQYVDEKSFEEEGYSSAQEASCEPGSLGSGSSGETASASLTGLTPNTVYHYRVLAENASGVSEGEDHNFLTLPTPPIASTGEASAITVNGATVSGSVEPGSRGPSSDTTYFFEYGVSASYGTKTPIQDAGQGTSLLIETANLTSLERDSVYHYRIVATNDNNNTPQTAHGSDQTLITGGPPPTIGGPSVSTISQDSAVFTATIAPQGLATRYELQVGRTQNRLQTVASGNTSSELPLVLDVGSLSSGTTYYYVLVATNVNGTALSPEGGFATVVGATPSNPLPQPPTLPLLTSSITAFPSESPTAGGVLGTKSGRPTSGQKLANALKACKKKPRTKRASCERQVRRKYGTRKLRGSKKR